MKRDPVCGMEVDEAKAEFKAEFEGTIYYFCPEACRTGFLKYPKVFTSKAAQRRD